MAAGGTDVNVGDVAGRVKDPNIKDYDYLVEQFYNNAQEAFTSVDGNLNAMNLPWLEGETKKIATKYIEQLRFIFRDPTKIGKWELFEMGDDDEPKYVMMRNGEYVKNWEDLTHIWCPLLAEMINARSDDKDIRRAWDYTYDQFTKPFEVLFKAVSRQFEEA